MCPLYLLWYVEGKCIHMPVDIYNTCTGVNVYACMVFVLASHSVLLLCNEGNNAWMGFIFSTWNMDLICSYLFVFNIYRERCVLGTVQSVQP